MDGTNNMMMTNKDAEEEEYLVIYNQMIQEPVN